jgi:molecular chaperone DnaJ
MGAATKLRAKVYRDERLEMERSTLSTHDYYEVLGVPRDADEQTIKAAFHRLARRYHPDRSTEPDAEERFKQVAAAYAVLSDRAKRADYDASGSMSPPGMTTEDLLRGIDLRDLLDLGLDLGGALFSRLFNGPDGGGGTAWRGSDVRADVEVPLTAVACGTEAPVRFRRTEGCPVCGGSGAKPDTAPALCGTCGDSGQRTVAGQHGKVLFRQSVTCEQCGGTGRVVRDPCAACAGRGNGQVEATITVKIPPGIEEGTMLRVHGRGQPSQVPGGPAGDLLIMVHSAPHPDLVRRGADLWHRQAIPVAHAVLGTNLTVSGLQNTITVKVPAGTQPGTVLRLAGQGLPHLRRRGRGDIYLTIDVAVPSSLTPQQRELYEQLRESPPPAKRRFWRRRSK